MEKEFDQWVMIELYGHQRIVGKASESTIGGTSFIRVDVPASKEQKGFTRYFGNNAIFSLNPVSEEVAMALLKNIRTVPVQQYEISQSLLEGPENADDFGIRKDGGE